MGDVILFLEGRVSYPSSVEKGLQHGCCFSMFFKVSYRFVVFFCLASFLLSAMCYVEGISLDDLLQIRCRRLTSRRTKEVLEIFSGVIKFTNFVVNQTMLMGGNFEGFP